MQIGYVRISKTDGSQNLDLQKDALIKVGVLPEKMYEDQASGKKDNREGLTACLKALREKDILVGLTGAFLCTKIFGTKMSKQNKGGNIVNISSDLGIIAPDQRLYDHTSFRKPVSYSVVKSGIIGLTKYTAAYWAKKKVRCNALAPGGIFNKQNKIFLSKIKKLIPMNRMAKVNEYNKTILFLSSNASSYITGSVVVADGGRTII